MSKKQGLICGGIAGALVIILVVVFCLNPFGNSKKGTNNSDVLASTDGGTTQSGDATIIDDTETPLDAGVGSNDADAPTDEAAEGAVLEGEEEEGEEGEEDEEEVEVVETSLSEATVLFTGSSEQSYEPTDLTWFLTASDDEVITLVYTCTVSANAGWGVLGWGATVNDVWVEGPGFSADASNASAQMYANFTVGELRRALGITAGANVTALKLGAWNGGQIVSLSLSAAGSTPVVSNAIETKLAGATASLTTDASGAIVGEETAKGLSGSYVKVFNTTGQIDINIAASCPGYEMGDSVRISVTVEGDGGFNGTLGTAEGSDYHWTSNSFETDKAGTLTCSLDATPTGDVAILGVWWIDGTAVGVKSISITVTKKGSSSATGDFSGCSQILSAPGEIIINTSSITGFEKGDTIKITATLYSDQYYNGAIGIPQTTGAGWSQQPQQECSGGTATWSWTAENVEAGEAKLMIWWMNGTKLGIKSLSATVVAKGTGAGGEEGDGTGEGEGDGTGEGEGTGTGGNTGAGGDSQGGGSQGDGSQSGGAGEITPDYAALVAKEGVVLSNEEKSGAAWNAILTFNTSLWGGTFDPSTITENSYVIVQYESTAVPELVFQDNEEDDAGKKTWAKVAVAYAENGYVVFAYKDMIAAYPDFTKLCALNVCAGADATVIKQVKVVEASNDGGNEDPVQPEKPEYIAKLTKETEYVTDSFNYNFKDYLASYEKGDKVKITVELEGDVYFNGAIGGSDVDAENSFASAQFVSGENNTAVATLIVTTPYDYDYNNGNVVLWWVNPQDGVAYPEVTVKSITLEVVEDEEDPEPAGPIATLSMESKATQSVTLYAENYAEGLAVGDVIKVAIEFESDLWFGGEIGYNATVVGADGTSAIDWLKASYANDDNNQAAVEFTYEVPYSEIGIQINLYWAGGESVSITSFTVEKVSSGEGGDDEGDSNEEPTNEEEPMKQEEPAGEDPEEDPKEDPKEGPVEDPVDNSEDEE